MIESIWIRKWEKHFVYVYNFNVKNVMPKLINIGLPDLLGVGSCQFVGASDVAMVGGETASSGE